MQNQGQRRPYPFLKWVGGKRQLLEELCRCYEMAAPTGRYHEPFVGGGALFFGLYRRGDLGRKQAFLSDTNERLIDTWLGIQQDVEGVISLLKMHKSRHNKEYYYQMRATIPEGRTRRTARIIYLNRTCFNGLFRENSRGEFNVPMGKYTDPMICDAANLRAVSQAIQPRKARIEARHFNTILDHAKPGDFVYFDPPYHPVSRTASFTSYAREGFGEKDQRELAGVYAALDQKGVHVLLSNSWTDLILDLYRNFTIDKVSATRNINSRADGRGAVAEVLVRNF